MKYYSTFPAGLSAVAKDMLSAHSDARVVHEGDGFLSYDCPNDPTNFPFFTNTFVRLEVMRGASVDSMMRVLTKKATLPGGVKPDNPTDKTFRVVTSEANQLVAVNPQVMHTLEKKIALATGLVPHRAKPDVEFWILQRTEGYSYFLRRLTRRASYEKSLKKGELHPELCHMMNWLSRPDQEDIYIDPFCGTGALPIARARYPYAHITASDIVRFSDIPNIRRFTACVLDALNLPMQSFNKIVTDPPWGFYGEDTPRTMDQFYVDMLTSFARALKTGGQCVIITGAKDAMTCAIAQSAFTQTARHDTLVSGKKAAIFVIGLQE